MGPATRDGCGALCPIANMPCRGCYGPPPNVTDQGAKMVSALGSVIDAHEPEEIEKILDEIVDPLGTFYRFSLAHSILRRVEKS
jgi:F420-non-reducing hydrogenase small subunit